MNHFSLQTRLCWLALFLIATLVGCAPEPSPPESPTGRALLGVSAQALSASDITRVKVVVSGPQIQPDITEDMTQAGGQWKGIIGKIPAGSDRTFTAMAYNAKGDEIYKGQATKVTIQKGKMAVVLIVLQQVAPPTPFKNTAPAIKALTATSNQVGHSEQVTLKVTAIDADGDPLQYSWTATGGSFASGATTSQATWVSPAQTPAPHTVHVTVSDPKGGKSSASLTIQVQPHFATGNAAVNLTFNTSPEVSQVTSSKGRLDVSQTTSLAATATDPDGDALTYTWSDGGGDCQGTFGQPTSATTDWTAPNQLPAAGTCTLTVVVSDGKGGQNQGQITLQLAPPPTPSLSPHINSTYQSLQAVSPGDTVVFRVTATEPQGGTLQFAWSDPSGAVTSGISNTGSGPYTSQLTWTAPSTPGSQTVTVTITGPGGTAPTTQSFSVTVQSSNQAEAWAASGATAQDRALGRDIVVDGSGNRYVVGYFQGTIAFGSTSLTATSVAGGPPSPWHLFVAKMDALGNWLWAKKAGGTVGVYGQAIALGSNNDLYITGHFQGQATFGTTTLQSAGNSDVCIARLDTNGAWQWARRAGGTLGDSGFAIGTDASGSVYAFGFFEGQATFGTTTLGAPGTTFLTKLNSSGAWQWTRNAGGRVAGAALSGKLGGIAVNGAGDVTIASAFSGTVTLGSTTLNSGTLGNRDILIARIDSSGTWQWAQQAGASGNDGATSVALDGNGGVYVTGFFQNTVSFGTTQLTATSGQDYFVAKLSSSGTYQWATQSGNSISAGQSPTIATDSSGKSYITGLLLGSLTFGSKSLTTAGNGDVFVASVSSSGAWECAFRGGGLGLDTPGSMAIDSNGAIAITGTYQGAATFGQTALSTTSSGDVLVWAPILNAQCTPPSGPKREIAAGKDVTCRIQGNGSVKCVGSGKYGELGNGTNQIKVSTPVTVTGITNAVQLAAGEHHVCALLADQTIKCWGYGLTGQLGNGGTTHRNTPVAVTGITNAVQISSKKGHTCALLADQTIKCWGWNIVGQIGDGTTTDRTTPVAVPGITNATQIAVGYNHTCALLADQTVTCWGANHYGALGDGTFASRSTPAPVTGLTNVVQVYASNATTFFVLGDGTVKAVGYNAGGQLGDGTTTNKNVPVALSGLSNVTSITAGTFTACALLANQTAMCWGTHYKGALGNGQTSGSTLQPAPLVGLTSIKQMAMHYTHSCAVLTNNNVYCWGYNNFAPLGDGTLIDRSTPTPSQL